MFMQHFMLVKFSSFRSLISLPHCLYISPIRWLLALSTFMLVASTGPSTNTWSAPSNKLFTKLVNQFNLRLTQRPVSARVGAVGFVVPSTHSYQALPLWHPH